MGCLGVYFGAVIKNGQKHKTTIMKLKSILFLAGIVFLISCNKKDKTPTRTELLTAGSWKITAIVSDNDANGTYETDDYAGAPSCVTDNYLVFRTNGTAEGNEGATKCDPADLQSESFGWNFANNEANLVIDGDTFIIMDLTNSVLKLKADQGGGATSMITFNQR
jgi:hypothetical protein